MCQPVPGPQDLTSGSEPSEVETQVEHSGTECDRPSSINHPTPLHILMVEDQEDDALLILRELKQGGYQPNHHRVDTRDSMATALREQAWDLVIADYNLPHFDALQALKLLQTTNLDLPFIIVSGNIGEDTAVAAMKAGAHDYLMKSNLARLVPAVERELREAQERHQRREAEQALRASEERFRSLIENALDVIIVMNSDGTIRYVSPSIQRVLGYSPDDLIGTIAFQYIHPNDVLPVYMAFQDAILSPGKAVAAEFRFVHQDNSWRVIEAVGKQLTEPDGSSSLIVNSRDITERKQAEETRKALQKEKELNELKSRFVSMVSHEFRTPLSVVVLSARLLERFYDTVSEEKRLQYLDRIQAAAKRMTQLLDDVLFLGKTEAGKQEFKPVAIDLLRVCREIVDELQLTVNSGHTIIINCQEATIPACMDETLLRHILTNLLSNGIKYSPEHKTIWLHLSAEQEWVTLQIQDQGIGIPADDLQELFVSFHRGSNVGKIPGTGLGLAIAHQSVHLHQGTIAVQSQLHEGTTFTINLPRFSAAV